MKEHSSSRLAKIINIALIIVVSICVLIILAMTFIFKNKNSAPSIFGYNIYIMNGTTMEPDIPKGTAVFTKTGDLPSDPEGRVALCNIGENDEIAVLRIKSVQKDNDGTISYIMCNDSSPATSVVKMSSDKIIGEATMTSNLLGAIIRFVTSKLGILILLIIPAALFLIFELITVLKRINSDDEADNSNTENDESTEIKDDTSKDNDINEKEIKDIDTNKNKSDDDKSKDDDKPEIFVEEDNVPKPEINNHGIAEYKKVTATSDIEELDKSLERTNVVPKNSFISPSSAVKTNSSSIDKLEKSIEAAKELAISEHEAKAFINENNIKPKAAIEPTHTAVYSTTKKKSTSNQTLEELMKLLNNNSNK